MQESFEVNQHVMLSCSNHIFIMKIRSFEHIEKCEIYSLTLIKTLQLCLRSTCGNFYEFRPTIASAIEYLQSAERVTRTMGINPGKQFLEMDVNRQRFRFIDQF